MNVNNPNKVARGGKFGLKRGTVKFSDRKKEKSKKTCRARIPC